MAFTAIETQEELDRIINERLSREREASAKKYEGYLSPDDVTRKYEGYMPPDDIKKLKEEYDGKLTELGKSLEDANGRITQVTETIAAKDKDIADRDAKIKGYETSILKTKIAQEVGLNYGMADRLRGEREEDIRKDAQALMKMASQFHVAPIGATEPVATGSQTRASLAELSKALETQNT